MYRSKINKNYTDTDTHNLGVENKRYKEPGSL